MLDGTELDKQTIAEAAKITKLAEELSNETSKEKTKSST